MPETTEVVECTIPVFNRLAKILINPGAMHSFVIVDFINRIGMKFNKLPYELEVKTPLVIKV
mgnify:FL=1